MKMTRFSEPQIFAILRQAEGGMGASDLCREHGMSTASFYKWRAKYGGMECVLKLDAEVKQSSASKKVGGRLNKILAHFETGALFIWMLLILDHRTGTQVANSAANKSGISGLLERFWQSPFLSAIHLLGSAFSTS